MAQKHVERVHMDPAGQTLPMCVEHTTSMVLAPLQQVRPHHVRGSATPGATDMPCKFPVTLPESKLVVGHNWLAAVTVG
jgi:hypothetical protein